MEMIKTVVATNENERVVTEFVELNESQLAAVGGGTGDVTPI